MPDAAPTGDRRAALADWMTAPDNPFFARNLANRVWAHFLGRGLVEPVDDVRATNPPTQPRTARRPGEVLVETSTTCEADRARSPRRGRTRRPTTPNATNEKDEQNYSRALFKRPDAEVLLDMVCQATGVPEKFHGVAGRRRGPCSCGTARCRTTS